MKKFLIFLVSLVIVVCLGLTTYYFMRNNEIITIETKEIYCNVGDTIPLNSLGIEIKKPKKSKKTTFNYNAGGEEVTKYIEYKSELNSYVVSNDNAGEVTLVISTTNKKYDDFNIKVHIGNGTVENPYFIFSESDLSKIGSTYRLDKNYILMNDITLTNTFEPIGYNKNTSAWEGFSGVFNGNGHTISGLNLSGSYANAGLFSSINSTASVKNLTISNSTISGAYEKAGILAAEVAGNVEKVVVKNATIVNSKDANITGAMAGVVSGNVVMSYVDGATITVGDEANATTAVVGGMFGKVDIATIQATYVNNATINATNATIISGGFAGEFVINTTAGSIQQSYANVSSSVTNFAGFIGKISATNGFDATKAIMLRHLIGNIAVVYGQQSSATILDTDLVKDYDNTYFTNVTYPGRPVFYDVQSSLYMVRGFASAGEVITTNEFVYYAVNSVITNWDTTYVWDVTNNSLPTLKMGSVYPTNPSNEYFLRDLTEKDLNNKASFVDTFKNDVDAQKIQLTDDIDVTDSWTPVAVKNSIIDGNNKTIKINLNNASNNCLALFTTVDNSTIRNLNIIVTGVSANAENAGALAGIITSSDPMTTTTIENVTVTFESFQTPVITNFGGLAGSAEKAVISNVKVNGLQVSQDAQITNAGSIVAINNATIQSCEVNATIYATTNVGGVVAINNATIADVKGAVVVNYNKNVNNAFIGGVAGVNSATIINTTLDTTISITNAAEYAYAGGVAGVNTGLINNVQLTGAGITISAQTGNVYAGGVVSTNDGTIENVKNTMANVGSYIEGKSYTVAGVAATNNGTILEVLTQSNVYGNVVAGVVATNNGTISEIAVGVYNKDGKNFTANNIAGDKYVAGIVVNLNSGSITDVQAVSSIEGKTNSTKSSLIALIFPNAASLKNATIDSSITGYGTKYREVWTDFNNASTLDRNYFGYSTPQTYEASFNLFDNESWHGSMQSVVINTAKDGVKDTKVSLDESFLFGLIKDYQDTSTSSFIKTVDGFTDFNQFNGPFTFVVAESNWFGIKTRVTKTLTFSIGDVWESNNGISLIFLNNM